MKKCLIHEKANYSFIFNHLNLIDYIRTFIDIININFLKIKGTKFIYRNKTISLKELIKENKNEFIVETRIDKKGKFGRLLGTLLKEVNSFDSFNEILVKEGHATEYYGGKR